VATKGNIMSNWNEAIESIDRINNKLDLILELVNAQKANDSKRVDEVCKQLDALKRIVARG
jgi:hypothetical protein